MEKEAEEKAVMEVKQEVQRVKILIEESLKNEEEENDDEFDQRLVDSAMQTLLALKELKEMRSDGGLRKLRGLGFQPQPKEFICPISGLVMEDPVVVSCGLTYERRCIEKWVLDGNRKRPGSDQELGRVSLIPNNLLKKAILLWCVNSFFKDKTLLAEEEDDAVEKLYGLSLNQDEEEEEKPPQEFLCPISGKLMENPVLVASGQTFDEPYIAEWVKDGNTKCPKTDQLLSHTLLIPNLSIKAIIHKWRSRIAPVQADEDKDGRGNELRDHLIDTLVKLPSILTTSEQLPLLKDLRLLTARLPSFRALFAEMDGAAKLLLNPYLIKMYKSNAELYNEVVATLMNISVEDPKIVRGCPSLIPFLIDALKVPVSIETRGYAAAALGQLSFHDSNSLVIGTSKVFQLLTDILKLRDPIASREAADAVLSLCFRVENRERFLFSGDLYSLVENLKDPALVDAIVEILAYLEEVEGEKTFFYEFEMSEEEVEGEKTIFDEFEMSEEEVEGEKTIFDEFEMSEEDVDGEKVSEDKIRLDADGENATSIATREVPAGAHSSTLYKICNNFFLMMILFIFGELCFFFSPFFLTRIDFPGYAMGDLLQPPS